jgi:hypothetical protein
VAHEYRERCGGRGSERGSFCEIIYCTPRRAQTCYQIFHNLTRLRTFRKTWSFCLSLRYCQTTHSRFGTHKDFLSKLFTATLWSAFDIFTRSLCKPILLQFVFCSLTMSW